MAYPKSTLSTLPYPELIIDPFRNLASYANLNDLTTPPTRCWDLDYRPEKEIGNISVRERGGAVYRCKHSGIYKVNVFQRSSWFAKIYPWNLSLIICPHEGRHIIRQVELCPQISGARGELCRRDYLYWNLCSHLVGRTVDQELLSTNQALRIQCTHLVELVRYAVAAFLRVLESRIPCLESLPLSPSKEWSPDGRIYDKGESVLLYSEGEITEVFRVKDGDIFSMLGTQRECFAKNPQQGSEGRLSYHLAIPDVQQALGKTLSGSVKVKPFSCQLQGMVGDKEFYSNADLANLAALDECIQETTQISPTRLLSSTLKDIVAYLSLGQLFSYPFSQGDQRSLYQDTVRKNSFCIGWKPDLIDQDVLSALKKGGTIDGMVMGVAGEENRGHGPRAMTPG